MPFANLIKKCRKITFFQKIRLFRHTLKEYLELIKFEHTVFALPFALGGMLLANKSGFPSAITFLWVLLAMIGARTAGMAFNRIIDAEIDKKNPRTWNRAIPAGRIKKSSALALAVVSLAVLVLAVFQLPFICRALLPFAMVLLIGYSYTKRYTVLCHLFLGAVLGSAAAGGWLAVSGKIDLNVILWGFAVMFWAAGFDIIYSVSDVDFDRHCGLYSIPAYFGIKQGLLISRFFHSLSANLFIILGFFYKAGQFYWIGVIFLIFALIYEHFLISDGKLKNINAAFFNVNGFVSIGFLIFIFIDKII